ncbi:MAG: poly-gamma-glutamate synthase PgsB, partial [Alphaproteobacteria bacterium]|nr:poly-gamma-glutamate synthase PgsB [Alphaproteobacteria bacterium]
MLLPGLILAFALALLLAEQGRLRRSVRRIPIRIHVVGTRGKSSLTRFVAAGLRASGKRTIGKITGIVPTIIDLDGCPQTIHRRGLPRVIEQMRII